MTLARSLLVYSATWAIFAVTGLLILVVTVSGENLAKVLSTAIFSLAYKQVAALPTFLILGAVFKQTRMPKLGAAMVVGILCTISSLLVWSAFVNSQLGAPAFSEITGTTLLGTTLVGVAVGLVFRLVESRLEASHEPS